MVLFIGNSRLAKLEQQTSDRQNSRLAIGRTVGCLSQTANENRFDRFLNNRNITPVPADIRKEEEKLILLFTLHPIAGNAFI